jgi:hypothetical protein
VNHVNILVSEHIIGSNYIYVNENSLLLAMYPCIATGSHHQMAPYYHRVHYIDES